MKIRWFLGCTMLMLALLLASCGSSSDPVAPPPAAEESTAPPPPTANPEAAEPGAAPEEAGEAEPYTRTLASDAAIPAGNTAVFFAANWGDPIGSLATISLASPGIAATGRVTTDGSDAVVRSFGGRIYVVNRFGTDTIQVIDPASFAVIGNYSANVAPGAGSNPQDIAVLSDQKAYITRLDAQSDSANSDDLLIVRPLTGERIGSIDLTPYTTDDGERLARAAQMVLVGSRLFVCLQDLPANMLLSADTNGKVVVIDTERDAVTDVIALAGRNPWDITYSPLTGKLYVANTGVYDAFWTPQIADGNGGIEVIDGSTLASQGIVVDDANLGAEVFQVRIASAELGFVSVGGNRIASFNPTTNAIIDTNVYQTTFYALPDFSIDEERRLVVADQAAANPGAVFVDAESGAVIAGPTGVGALPVSVTFADVAP